MGGAVPLLTQCAFMAWCSVRGSTGTTLSYMTLVLLPSSGIMFIYMSSFNFFFLCTVKYLLKPSLATNIIEEIESIEKRSSILK